jgi:hypothetical protein
MYGPLGLAQRHRTSKKMDFVSYDSQNVSYWVLITDKIHLFNLSVKVWDQGTVFLLPLSSMITT